MSQWRIRGYVLDSDEEDDLDLDLNDAYSPNLPEANTTALRGVHVHAAPRAGSPLAAEKAIACPAGSQDELALDSSQNGMLHRASSILDAAKPDRQVDGSSTQPGFQEQSDGHDTIPEAPTSSANTYQAGYHSSEIPTANPANALSKKFLATQLFSDDQSTYPPGPNAPATSSRPVTLTRPYDDLDELQQDWLGARNGGISALSSPLSDARSDIEPPDDLRSSPPLPALRPEIAQSTGLPENGGVSRQFAHVAIPQPRRIVLDDAAFDQLDDAEKTRIKRALRKRNPIQLHPYLLEAEKYRQNLKARGMRPVNVGPEHHRHHEKHQEKDQGETQNLDSQDRDFVVDQSSSVRHSSPVDLPSSPPRAGPSRNPPVQSIHISNMDMDTDDDDFDFPDLSVILQRKNHGEVQQGVKRRKTMHTFSKKATLNRPSSLPQSPHANRLGRKGEASEAFEMPPSPPASETPPMQDGAIRKLDRFPRLLRLSPFNQPQPPTPAMSSSKKQGRATVIASDLDDDDDAPLVSTARRQDIRRTGSITVVPSGSSSSESENIEDNVLQRARKRIKGVLPASWLRLDQQAQANKKATADPPRHQRRTSGTSTRLGIADSSVPSRQARQDASKEHNGPADPIVVEDGSSGSDGDMHSVTAPQPQRNLDLELGFADSFEELGNYEVQEHDWVDPMAPSTSRQNANKKQKRRQLKLTDAIPSAAKRSRLDSFDRPAPARATNRQPSKKKSRANGQQQSRRQPKIRPPNLSILDAPILNSPGSTQVPQFLKLAARQVRRQPNKGRHSPTNKYIRLQTEMDTEEANAALREWRTGKVKSSTKHGRDVPEAITRPPLSDRAANEQGNLLQQQLPEPEMLRGDGGYNDETATANEGATRNRGVGRPRMRQVKLQPVTIPRNSSPAPSSRTRQSRPNISIANRPATQRARPKQAQYRTAQLERTENEHDSRHRAAAFHKKLSQLDRVYAASNQFRNAWIGQQRNPRLAKFLEDEDEVAPLPIHQPETSEIVHSIEKEPAPLPVTSKRRLKAKVQRIDVETREYRQPSDPLPGVQNDSPPPAVQSAPVHNPRLEGLGPFGTRYSTDFDVSPLWSGTFFHEGTVVGSGEFQQALKVGHRDLDAPTGIFTFSHNGTVFRWGAWTEEVASEMASLMSSTTSRFEDGQSVPRSGISADTVLVVLVDYLCLLRNVVRYFSGHLHFLDPIDRRSFVAKMQGFLDSACGNILADLANLSSNPFQGQDNERSRVRLLLMLSLLAHQVTQIASHPQIDTSIKQSTELVFKGLVKPMLQLVLRNGMGDLRAYIDENRRHAVRERGIREDRLAVESLIMVHHMLNAYQSPHWSFWSLVIDEWTPSISRLCHIRSFERLWYDVFALLPYLRVDSDGLVKANQGSPVTQGDWSLVVPMLNRLFALYPETTKSNEASVNAYVRSCLTRCYNLIHSWGWKRCDSLLTTIFDFFAHRDFTHLQNEENKGSLHFLEDLNHHPHLKIQPDDRAFHMFMKVLAIGLRGLRHICTGKQIHNITWRLLPVHRRTYRKEEDIRQEDLDGLRNQHALLCTLYWASPPGYRPRLMSLRNLVDQNRSHREVCRLSVRAWSNLARFQISTDEGTGALDSFADWFKEIISQNLAQHKLAKSEAEGQYATAQQLGNETISPEHLQLTIKNNQAQILATLGDAVYGMKAAMGAAHDVEGATFMLEKSSIADVFKLFDAKNSQASKLAIETLEVFQAFLRLLQSKEARAESQQSNEDSQDYGEWFALEDVEPTASGNLAAPDRSIDFLHDAVWQMVSSCFGAETCPDDQLLTTAVETWSMVAHRLVRKGQKSWSNFLDSYNANSWRQLQDTEQTRKFSALFMSVVLNRDPSSYESHKDGMFWAWFISLVERESMLKFQHRLTNSLMNRDPDHPLFRNLPFLKDSKSGRVNVEFPEFRQRRLGLISSLLANMRDDYEAAMQAGKRDLPGLRREYAGLLKQLMAAMKKNYLELGSVDVKSAYVEFVQSVVEFLQEHTHDICPVDQFFTDSSAFPLPAADPTYVVGRLKSYVPKLSEQRTLKQLMSFVQNVSERAAVDNEQDYLVSQICTATVGTYERGDISKPSLRQVLLGAIFPAYIEQTFKTTAGWILAKPLLQASCSILQELNYQSYQYSISDSGSVSMVDSALSVMLDALYSTTELLITHSGLLEQPHVLHILSWIFAAVTATILPASYIYRRTGHAVCAVQRIDAFKAFSLFAASTIIGVGDETALSPYPPNDPEPVPDALQRFADVRQLCAKNLEQALGSGAWVKQGEQYYLVRKNGRRPIHVAVGTLGEEKQRVIGAIEEFHAVLRLAFWRGEEDLAEKRRRGKERAWPTREGEMLVI